MYKILKKNIFNFHLYDINKKSLLGKYWKNSELD